MGKQESSRTFSKILSPLLILLQAILCEVQGKAFNTSKVIQISRVLTRNVTTWLRTMSRHPEVKWAEREDKVYITVLLPDAKDIKVNLDPVGVFSFTATAGAENHIYELKFDLHDKVNVEGSKISTSSRNILCVVEKANKGWWKKLSGEGKTPHYIKVDWDKWVDEDDDAAGGADLDFGGMDFSKFGGMEGMDDDDISDPDEEGQEAEKTEGTKATSST